MKLNEYQKLTERTAPHFDDTSEELCAWSMGIAGESGEFCDAVKKVLWHGHDLKPLDLALELGDLLYYISRAGSVLGYTLDEIATLNIEKLMRRYPNGFSSEASINREE